MARIGRRVLVVDDDRDQRETAGEILRLAGHEVAIAADGQEALQHLDGGFAADVIFLDLLMPGLDGATFLERLDGRTPPRPRVVLVTGMRPDHLGWLVRVDAVLTKPYSPGELLAEAAGGGLPGAAASC